MCGLDLPPSKFHVSILNHIGCELVHLNPNTISTLNCFCMLCECWLGIPPDTDLFWYFYSHARYERKVFFDIGLTLCRNCQYEYLTVTFKWFHVNLGDAPQWLNKHLPPPLIGDRQKSPSAWARGASEAGD
jgi:hypothetical protein